MQQFSSLLSRRLFTAQHVSGVFPSIIELLMMDGKTPETWWAVNKHRDNKLENCCIWLVIYLNCTMMHGLTNLKKNCHLIYVLLNQGMNRGKNCASGELSKYFASS
jgi:hypothetical protein